MGPAWPPRSILLPRPSLALEPGFCLLFDCDDLFVQFPQRAYDKSPSSVVSKMLISFNSSRHSLRSVIKIYKPAITGSGHYQPSSMDWFRFTSKGQSK